MKSAHAALRRAQAAPDFTIDALDRRLLLATFPVTSFLLGPLESLVGGAQTTVTAGSAGQSDTYEFDSFYDGKVSVAVRPLDPSMQLRVTYDGVTETGAVGEPVILRNVARPAGPESVGVEVLTGSGDYLIDFATNADWELENFGGPSNDIAPAAQAIDDSAIPLGTGDRMAVRGSTDNGAVDVFSFDVAAEQPVSVAISGVAGFDVLDPAGNMIVDAADGAGNVTEFVKHFETTTAGTYFIRVTGFSAGTYNLVATRGLTLGIDGTQDLLPGTDVAGFGQASSGGNQVTESEFNDDIFSANDADSDGTAIVIDGFIEGSFGDVDMFYLGFVSEFDILEIDLDLVDFGGDSILRLFDEFGDEIAYSDDDNPDDELDEFGDPVDDSSLASYIFFDAFDFGYQGDVYLGVSSFPNDFYDPFGGGEPDFDGEDFNYQVNVSFNGNTPDGSGGGDRYDLIVNAGETITLSAADSTEFFVDLALDLFDETGTLILSADDTNGFDPSITFTVPTGTPAGSRYTAVVRTNSGFGGYLVGSDHSITVGPTVTSATFTDPYRSYDLDGVASFPESISVTLSDAVLLSSVDLGDLQIITPDGTSLSANGFTQISGNRFVFDTFGLSAEPGLYELRIESGDLLGASGLPLAETFSQTFDFLGGPRVIGSSVMPGDIVPAGPFTYRATFDRPLIDFVSGGFFGQIILTLDDVTLTDAITGATIPGSTLSYQEPDDEDPYFDWSVNDLDEGVWELRLLAEPLPNPDGTFNDGPPRIQGLGGISLDGTPSFGLPSGDGVVGDDFVVNFLVDRTGVTAMPALEAVEPFQSGIYTSRIGGTITDPADVDTFSLANPGDGPIALTLTHVGGAGQFRVIVRDSGGTELANVAADAAGGDVVLPVLSGTDFEIEVTSVDGGTGAYRIDAAYGATNAEAGDTAATATDIAPTLISYTNGSGRYGALGSVSTSIIESVEELSGGFTLYEPRVVEFAAGADPVGDVVFQFDSSEPFSAGELFVSLEGVVSRFVGGGSNNVNARRVTISPEQYRELAADGVIRISVRPNIGVVTGGSPTNEVTITESKPVADDADLFRVPTAAGEEVSLFIDSTEFSDVFVRFEDANGNVLASDQPGSEQTSFPNERIATYVPDQDGEVYARVVGAGGYVLTVGKDATVRGHAFNPASIIGPSGKSIDDLRAFSAFVNYRFFAKAGDVVTVETGTPFMPEGNDLNPSIQVSSPSGVSLGADGDSGEAVNARLTFTATETGYHNIRVNRNSGGGLLTLTITGNSADDIPPTIVEATPADGGLAGGVAELLFRFDEPVQLGANAAAALSVDNETTVNAVEMIDAYTVRYTLDSPGGNFDYAYTLAAGAVTDVYGNANAAFAGIFVVNPGGPVYVDSTPAQAAAPFSEARFNFDFPIDPASVTLDDLIAFTGPGGVDLLDQIDSFNGIEVVDGSIVLRFADQTVNGDYTFTFRPTIQNTLGTAIDQDQDGTPGEVGDDNVVAVITLANPDLAVAAATAPPTVTMTVPFVVDFTVENVGTDPATAQWADRILISTSPILDGTAESIYFERTADVIPLADGATYNRTPQITLGLDTNRPPGTYYLHVVADTNGQITEANEADNIVTIGPITVEAPALPNLTATNVTAPAAASSGETVNVTWTLTNAGDQDFTGTFNERLFISTDDTIGGDQFLKDVPFTGTLLAGQSISRTATVDVPLDADGERWFVVSTDIGDVVEEYLNETDNAGITSTPTTVTLAPQVDLIPSNIQGPTTALSGETIVITWTITNDGTADFNGTYSDRLYLSSDDTIGSDSFIGDFSFTGTIPAGSSVLRTVDITLPVDLDEDRFIVVQSDVFNQVVEVGGEANNAAVSNLPIDISLAPQPDLVTSNVDGPDSMFSGETTTVTWTVTNQGTADTNASVWYDHVYLSLDDEINTGDQYLGRARNAAFLRPGESYANSLDVTIPIEFAGNYQFVVRADGNNNVREVGLEDNNDAASQTIDVQLTPPPDLTVGFSNSPNNAFSGQPVLVTFRVDNIGQTPSGGFNNRIWLSNDDQRGGDTLLQTFSSPGIAANGSVVYEQFVTIPVGLSGEFFFLFEADAINQVFEGPFENNNLASEAVSVLLTPPPDLVATPVSVPTELVSGKPAAMTFRVDNLGSTATDRGSWTDAVYISDDDILDGTDQRIGTRNYNGVLQPGEGYDTTIGFTVPVDASGTQFLILRTDYLVRVFELDRDNNLIASSVDVAEELPDLRITSNNLPSTLVTGEPILVDYSVVNEGIGDTRTGQWEDRLYLSTDETFGFGDLYLGRVLRDEILDAGESYDASLFAAVPQGTDPGDYFLILRTDHNNRVFEGEDEVDNDIVVPVAVTENLPNLVVSDIAPQTPTVSGSPITVTWTTTNQGGGPTETDYWEESVYLSTDSIFDPRDPRIGIYRNYDILDAGESYTGGISFTEQVPGDYFVIVVTDSFQRVPEGVAGEVDNITVQPITITPGPTPDLIITSIDAADTGFSGRDIDIDFTVRNDGDLTTGRNFFTTFYLSADTSFDSGDQTLKSVLVGDLDAQSELPLNTSVRLPAGVTGNWFIVARVDSGGYIPERNGELNNTAADPDGIDIELAPPVDLVAGLIPLPVDAFAGQDASITYSVTNSGPAEIIGSWTDSLYISADPVWDINDPLFSEVRVTGPVADGETYTRTATAPLPGLPTGDYYVIVRSDILNFIVETNEDNNASATMDAFEITIPQLTLDVPVDTTVQGGRFVYYRVEVTADQTLLVDLNATSGFGATELYVKYDSVASRNNFDFAYDRPLQRDQRVVVPNTQAGTYFVTAFVSETDFSPDNDLTITARLVPFGLLSENLGIGGNAGLRTVEIDGARFDRTVTATLVTGGTEIAAQSYFRVDDAKLYATFDLTGIEASSFGLRLDKASTGESDLTLDVFEVVDTLATDGAQFNGITPGSARPGAPTPLTMSWGNSSLNDVFAPVLQFSDIGIGYGFGGDSITRPRLTFVGLADSGPRGILPPGAASSIVLTSPGGLTDGTHDVSGFVLSEDPSVPIDYELVREDLRELQPTWSQDRFDQAFDRMIEVVGPDWGALLTAMSESANRLITNPQVAFVPELLELNLIAAYAELGRSIGGHVTADSFRVDIANRVVEARNIDTGERFLTTTYRDGRFHLLDVSEGTYRLTVTDGLPIADVEVQVGAEDAVAGIEIALQQSSEIRGTVFDGDGSPVQPEVTLLDGPPVSLRGDVDGTFRISGLEAGDYRLMVDADGLARRIIDVTVGGDGDIVLLNTTLEPESIIRGKVTIDGQPIGIAELLATVDVPGQPPIIGTTGGGIFLVEHLSAGTYDLTLKAEGSLAQTVSVTIGAAGEVDLGTIDLTLAASASGTVDLVDLPDVQQITVQLFRDGEPFAQQTIGVDDEFNFGDLEAGDYDLRVIDGQGVATPVPFSLAEGEQRSNFDLDVFPGGNISGQVTLNGFGVGGIAVSVTEIDGEFAFTRRTNANGSYDVGGLPVGDYVVVPVVGDVGSTAINIPSLNTEREIDFAITSEATIGGMLLGANNAPAGEAIVQLRRANDEVVIATTQTNAAGVWSFAILEPGDFVVSATAGGQTFGPTPVTVNSGDDLDLSLTAGSASLSVQTANVTGGGGARVLLMAVIDGRLDILDGQFVPEGATATFNGLGPGTYQIDTFYADGREDSETVTITAAGGTVDADAAIITMLTGNIVDAAGDSLSAGVVTLTDPVGGAVVGTSVLRPDGSFSVVADPGTYDVTVTVEGVGSEAFDTLVLGGAPPQLILDTTTQRVTGRLIAGVNPVSGGAVRLLNADGVEVGSATVGTNGTFEIFAIDAPGSTMTLEVERLGYASDDIPVVLSGGVDAVGDVAVTAIAFGIDAPELLSLAEITVPSPDDGFLDSLSLANFSRASLGFPNLEISTFGDRFVLPSEAAVEANCPACLDELIFLNTLIELEQVIAQRAREANEAYERTAQDAFLVYVQRAAKLTGAVAAAYVGVAAALGVTATSAAATAATAAGAQGTGAVAVAGFLESAFFATGVLDAVVGLGQAVRGLVSPSTDVSVAQQKVNAANNSVGFLKGTFDTSVAALTKVIDSADDFYQTGFTNVGAASAVLGLLLDLKNIIFDDGIYNDMKDRLADVERDLRIAETAIWQLDQMRPRIENAHQRFKLCLQNNCDDQPDWDEVDRLRRWQARLARVESFDPNDILGPEGYGDSRFVTAEETLGYRIRFENEETATAPAQFIRIENPLDDSLDFRTFRLGGFGFNDVTVEVPEDVPFFQTRLDLTETKGFLVEVTAGIDIISGVAFWEFETLDPDTGQRPVDPTIGLLPINDGTGIGEGFVDYTVRSRTDTPTGTVIAAEASIIFDANAPILTPEWAITIDGDKPTSIASAPTNSETTTFNVAWAGSDPTGGSGLATYSVFVSVDGGPYEPWLLGTELTSAPYQGAAGRTYEFVTIAQDNASNREALPQIADATVVVAGSSVVGRHIFYNDSGFDGDAGPSVNDDAAIAPDKVALLPGGVATFANYTSYINGLNGIMIDIAGLPDGDDLSVDDFAFTVGNDNDPEAWTEATAPTSITVRRGAGEGGSDRVTLIWDNGAITKTWLEVTVRAMANTGLSAPDVFYFGNAPGETGNIATDAIVNAGDVILTRQNLSGFSSIGLDSNFDFDRDGDVDAGDAIIVRNNLSGFTPLRLINLSGESDGGRDSGGAKGTFGGVIGGRTPFGRTPLLSSGGNDDDQAGLIGRMGI
ncbi:MAG: CARDB domain-containing protein [Planctomycetota bacterium]